MGAGIKCSSCLGSSHHAPLLSRDSGVEESLGRQARPINRRAIASATSAAPQEALPSERQGIGLPASAASASSLAAAAASSRLMLSLVRDLLDRSRMTAGRFELDDKGRIVYREPGGDALVL